VQAALSGYFTIWSVIGVGWLAAHVRILDDNARRILSRLAFTVASPALLFTLVSRADLRHLFSMTLVASALAIVAVLISYLLVARLVRGRGSLAERVVGALCAGYTNAGNLGLPIAAYVLGDMTWMAPILLIQIGVLQPAALALLDASAAKGTGQRQSWVRYVSLPFRNPLTVGTLAGLLVNAVGWQVPELIWAPASMVGAMAVPAMLIAFGVSLRLDPLPGRGAHAPELLVVTLIKVVLHPLIAYLLAAWVFGLPTPQVLAVTVIAALPTAQNIFLIAGRYQVGFQLARDAIFVSTLGSIPVIIAASTWLR
jgi:malonate transporter and related proteins